jgi:XK-related protein
MASETDSISVPIVPLALEENFATSDLSDSVDSLASDPIQQNDSVDRPEYEQTRHLDENEQSGLMSRLGWSEDFANEFLDERISDKSSHWLYVPFLSLTCCDSLKKKRNHVIYEKIFLNAFLPILGFLIDIVFDVILLVTYWSEKSMWNFKITLMLIVVPTILQLIICISLEWKSLRRNWSWKELCAICVHSRTAR